MAISYPPTPAFVNRSEEEVFKHLERQLPEDAHIFSNVRIHDVEGEHEIDFVVILPRDGIVVIEVKGGYIQPTDGGKFTQRSRNEERTIDPVGQVSRNRHALDRLLKSRTSMGFNVRTATLVVFADSTLNKSYRHTSIPRDLLVDRDELNTLSSSVLRSLTFETGGRSAPTLDQSKRIAETLKGQVFDSANLNDIRRLTDERSNHTKELVQDNKRYLDLVSRISRFYLKGPAGSGKTAMAMELAQRHTNEGDRVLFLTYNRALALWLHHLREEQPRPQRISAIKSIHPFMEEWGVVFPDDRMNEFYETECAEQFRAIASNRPIEEKFDVLIIDEAQDFSDLWIESIMYALKDPQTAPIYLFGDDRQELVHRRGSFGHDFAPLTLHTNIRNSQQIAELANLFTDEPSVSHGFPGPDVLFVEIPEDYTTFEATSDVINYLLDNDWNHNQIGVLTIKHRHPMHREGAKFHGDNYFRKLWKADDVFAATVGSFKGLDRPAVILGVDGFHEDMDPEDVMYSGITRARDLLIVVSRLSELEANFTPVQIAALTANPIEIEFANDEEDYDAESE